MQFVTNTKQLIIELQGREQVWALKAKLCISKKDITYIQYRDIFSNWRKWEVRLPGAGVPGKVIAGSFWTEEGWDFLYLTNPHGWIDPFVHNVLYIETNQQKFKRIILSCKPEEAAPVVAWANK